MKFTLYPPQGIYELGKRDNQEDAIYPKMGEATNRDRLFILCDGLGGHEKGEVASNTISKALAEYLDKNASADEVVNDDILLAALEYAYHQLDAKDDGAAKKMGTTLCLLLFHRGGLTAMHIGDSRIYHIRPSENRLLYQSKDHSLVYDLYQAGEISYDEMRTSPQKNIITRAIQPGEDNRVRPSIVHITDIKPGDYFYICSDGMLEQMENEELCHLFSANTSDDKKRQQLIAATTDNKDNHSAYFIHVNQVVMEEGDDRLLNDEQTSSDNALNINPRVESSRNAIEDDVEMVEEPASDIATVQPPLPPKRASVRKKHLMELIGIFIVLVIIALAVKAFLPKKQDKTEKVIVIEKVEKPKQEIVSPAEESVDRHQTNPSTATGVKKTDGKNNEAKAEKSKDKQPEAEKKSKKETNDPKKIVDQIKQAEQEKKEGAQVKSLQLKGNPDKEQQQKGN